MYGFVNSALEKLIRRRFGSEKWEEIRQKANVELGEKSSFLVNTVYNDDDTYILIGAAAEVLGLDPPSLLEMFGEQFLVWCKESGYAKTLQLLGRSLPDFLTNLDALHDHLSIIYPSMDSPSFRCTEGASKTEFHLHYYSGRAGLESIVKGIVKTVAREFYNTEVAISLIKCKNVKGSDHSVFRIREESYYQEKRGDVSPTQVAESMAHSDKNLISPKAFCKSFPFHIIFDRNMEILQMGISLAMIIPDWNQKDKLMPTYFTLERPRMRLTYLNIISHINTVFIVRMAQSASSVSDNIEPMRLRGQMIHLPDSDSILFLCSPRVRSIDDLDQRGLYLSDIPLHDATRGLLMMSQTATTEFHHVVQLEEVIGELDIARRSLEEEKGRMRDLLHQMLPITVADSLMAGQMIEAERFESVTILFSDIFGFTKICGKCEPIQIVSMLNKLYTLFDTVVGQNGVYKVETIGDAYMVVGGLPEPNDDHAVHVANQALDMMHYCQQVIRPDSEEPVQIRIGVHSGPVVAGIVGCRMPRYCLFGNTVNIASRAESNGQPGKIQVTETTYELLSQYPNFEFQVRGALEFKNVDKPMMCYFLTNNTEKEHYFPIEVPEEISYDFMTSTAKPTGTPPQTPYAGFPGRGTNPPGATASSPIKKPTSFPFNTAPELRVIESTPIHTPETSPPSMGRPLSGKRGAGGLPMSCPFSEGTKPAIRKISLESAGTNGTESTSLTHSESDYSIEDSSLDMSCIQMSSTTQSPSPSASSDTQRYPNILVSQSKSFDTGTMYSHHPPLPPPGPPTTGVLSMSKSVPKIHPLLEEDDLHSKSDTNLVLRKTRSLSSSDNNNDMNHRETSPAGYERNGRSVSEESMPEDSSLPTSPTHISTLFVRPRSSSLRERINIFDSIGTKTSSSNKRRTGLSTTSYLQSSSLTSFEEDDPAAVDNGNHNGGSESQPTLSSTS